MWLLFLLACGTILWRVCLPLRQGGIVATIDCPGFVCHSNSNSNLCCTEGPLCEPGDCNCILEHEKMSCKNCKNIGLCWRYFRKFALIVTHSRLAKRKFNCLKKRKPFWLTKNCTGWLTARLICINLNNILKIFFASNFSMVYVDGGILLCGSKVLNPACSKIINVDKYHDCDVWFGHVLENNEKKV